jgi:hypothetical protein
VKRRRRLRKAIFAAFLLLPVAAATGCRAHLVRVSVVNKTGAAANLVEVDYPSASFGIDILPAGAVYRCRLQLLDSGPLSVQFTGADRHQHKIAGPTVEQPEEGSLEIDLLPGGKAEFHPRLTMPR